MASRSVTLALTILWLASGWAIAADTGAIAGRVLDADGEGVAESLVVVFDSESGLPADAETFSPLTESNPLRVAAAVCDADGAFRLEGVKQGTYRLVAQSWPDGRKSVKSPFDVNGQRVRLDGIAESVRVPSAEATTIELQPLGTATLEITTDPQAPNNETLLVVSSAPLAADPILALSGWSGPFMPNLLAGNRMPLGARRSMACRRARCTWRRCPSITIPALAAPAPTWLGGRNDRGLPCRSWRPGATAITLRRSVSSRWSTEVGQMDAADLQRMIFEQHPDMENTMRDFEGGILSRLAAMAPYLDREVELAPGRRLPLKDVAEAQGYVRLARAVKERANRPAAAPRPPRPAADRSVTYEQAFAELHRTLGQNYPCFELKEIDWESVGQRLLPRAKDVANDEEFGLLCLELVAALEDSHAQLLAAAAPLPRPPLPSWDAGFACLVDERGQPVVYFVAPDSPAAAAGVKVGMTVLEVNGTPAAKAIKQAAELLSRYYGYSSDRYLRYDAFRWFARQFDRGAKVTLHAADVDGQEQTFKLAATRRPGYLPRLPVPRDGIADSADVSWKMLDGDVGYIYVRRIGQRLVESLDAAVAELKDARGLIIDVRGNSGGGFDAALRATQFRPRRSGRARAAAICRADRRRHRCPLYQRRRGLGFVVRRAPRRTFLRRGHGRGLGTQDCLHADWRALFGPLPGEGLQRISRSSDRTPRAGARCAADA